MIKTELITKHTICCPHCKGKIENISKKSEVDELFRVGNAYRYSTISADCKAPTCTSCAKRYEIKVDGNDFTITITEVK